ncbi:MAG TPA: hypothetical protein VG938_09720 [Verrucomicrobiae bacterium]|jgi:hypothetical protein|nr:hypothetical protein [Verrucomicrobiae bacterium]
MSVSETNKSERDLKWLDGWSGKHIQSFSDENVVRRYWDYKWFLPTNVKNLHKFVSYPVSVQQTTVYGSRAKELEEGFLNICETLGTMRFCQFCISMDTEDIDHKGYQVEVEYWIQYHYNNFLNEAAILKNLSNNYFKRLERSACRLGYRPLEKSASATRESLEQILAEFQVERNQHVHERRAKRSSLTTAGLHRRLKPELRSTSAAKFVSGCRELLRMDQKLILWKTGMTCFQYEIKLATGISTLRILANMLARDLRRIKDNDIRAYFLQGLAK